LNGYLVNFAVVNTVPVHSLMIVVTKKVCANKKENLCLLSISIYRGSLQLLKTAYQTVKEICSI